MAVEVISDIPGFQALKPEWNVIASGFDSPLHRHEWFAAYLEAFGDLSDFAIFVVRTDGAVRAIAPLVVDRSSGVARLVMSSQRMREPSGFLYADRASLTVLCEAVLGSGMPVVLARLGMHSEEVCEFRRCKRPSGLFIARAGGAVARVPLNLDWSVFEARISSGLRSFVRRKRKIAEREGPLRFETVSPDAVNVDAYAEQLFRLEAAGWKSRAGTAILRNPRMHRFFLEYARRAAQENILRMFFLKIGTDVVAARMAVEYGARLWELKIGYDERWAKCSPGILLTHETLRYCCERGLVAHEFLGGAEHWQARWPIELRRDLTPRFYPLSLRGGVALSLDACEIAVKRATKRLNGYFVKTTRPLHAEIR